jgi:hypothetical protein
MVRSRRRDEETVMPEQEGQATADADLETLLAVYREARSQVAEAEIVLQYGEAELGSAPAALTEELDRPPSIKRAPLYGSGRWTFTNRLPQSLDWQAGSESLELNLFGRAPSLPQPDVCE